ncbi:hypothetical protein DIPPA_06396 [Diplonema papillatum]|nr:hypothetical protein DIPPA_06396 [Diplonema papillatum]
MATAGGSPQRSSPMPEGDGGGVGGWLEDVVQEPQRQKVEQSRRLMNAARRKSLTAPPAVAGEPHQQRDEGRVLRRQPRVLPPTCYSPVLNTTPPI